MSSAIAPTTCMQADVWVGFYFACIIVDLKQADLHEREQQYMGMTPLPPNQRIHVTGDFPDDALLMDWLPALPVENGSARQAPGHSEPCTR